MVNRVNSIPGKPLGHVHQFQFETCRSRDHLLVELARYKESAGASPSLKVLSKALGSQCIYLLDLYAFCNLIRLEITES